jgi:hypothetical protein
MLTGAGHVTVNPVTGLVTAVRVTVPAKLKVLVRLTEIAAPVAPELKLTGVVVEMVKSPTWTTTGLAVWEAVPGEPAPVIVTVYVPAVVEDRVHEAATVAFAVMLTGAGHVTVNPVTGLVTAVRVTVPAKSKVLVRLTEIAAPVAPELKLTGVVVEMVKLPTWTTTGLAMWEAVPGEPAPVIVTV